MWFQTPRPAVLSEGSWPAVVTASVPPLAYENLAGKDLITVFGLLQSVTVSCAFHVPSRPSPHVTSRPLAEPDSSDCAMAVELAVTTAGQLPSLSTAGLGVWNHMYGRTYSAVSEAFIFSSAGAWTSTQRLTRVIVVSRDAKAYTDTVALEILDTSGKVIITGCATSVASRLE